MPNTPPDALSTPAHNAPHAAEVRRRDLAHIHMAIKQLAMADADYRTIISRISRGRSTSAADLSAPERLKLLSHLRALGYRPRKPAGSTPSTASNTRYPARPSTPLARKARALWIQAAGLGVVRNPSEQALAAFAQSAVGVRWAGTVPNAQAAAVVEAIKAMLARTQTPPQLSSATHSTDVADAVQPSIQRPSDVADAALAVFVCRPAALPDGRSMLREEVHRCLSEASSGARRNVQDQVGSCAATSAGACLSLVPFFGNAKKGTHSAASAAFPGRYANDVSHTDGQNGLNTL